MRKKLEVLGERDFKSLDLALSQQKEANAQTTTPGAPMRVVCTHHTPCPDHPSDHPSVPPSTHSFIHLLIYSPSQSLICYQVNTCPLTPCEPDTEWTLGIPGHRGRHSPPSLSGSGPVGRRTVKLVSQGLPRREAALRSRCGRVNWVPRGSFGPSSLLWRQSQALKFSVATPLRPPFSLLAHQERPEVGEIGGAAH